ncbi:hypothetical protein Mapa_007236 [Marchantia paleacea]|nr:hypothetical protein Mapa_007236 [Marchantia paleacea]
MSAEFVGRKEIIKLYRNDTRQRAELLYPSMTSVSVIKILQFLQTFHLYNTPNLQLRKSCSCPVTLSCTCNKLVR